MVESLVLTQMEMKMKSSPSSNVNGYSFSIVKWTGGSNVQTHTFGHGLGGKTRSSF